MKRTGALWLLCLSFLCVAVVLGIVIVDMNPDLLSSFSPAITNTTTTTSVTTTTTTAATTTTTKPTTTTVTTLSTTATTATHDALTSTTTKKRTTTTKKPTGTTQNVSLKMEGALFIGDSRTVGIAEYSGITGADFFADVGMSVYNIHQKNIDVDNVGKVSLNTLLGKKKYDAVYIMLGINEVGYTMSNTVAKYRELVELIREKQPNTLVFIQANLHVSKKRSNSDKYANNPNLNKLNGLLAQLADGDKIHYLDANVLFDDAEGHLASHLAGDGVHLYAKHYKDWGKWLVQQTNAVRK